MPGLIHPRDPPEFFVACFHCVRIVLGGMVDAKIQKSSGGQLAYPFRH